MKHFAPKECVLRADIFYSIVTEIASQHDY